MEKGFSKFSDIINESALKQMFGQALDKCMLFEFWKNIAGKKFEKVSIPYEIKGGVLFVSVASSTVAQELGFFKADLIKNAMPYVKGLKFNLVDIRFNYKNWREIKAGGKSAAFDESLSVPYTEEDFNSVDLTENERKEFDELYRSLLKNDFIPESVREKFYNSILNQFKAQKLRKNSK